VTNTNSEELEGTTLNVYAYLVKEGNPVGPREVMRATNLSSPSVAYWHLQKLEALGLLDKNKYGEYVVKEKIGVSGHLWIGRNLVPRLIFYSFFFMGILGVEIGLIAVPFLLNGQAPALYLFYLITPTTIATVLFLGEGLILRRKTRPETAKRKLAVEK
jgi:DNA-binding transcriptional ArsR family regulator